MPSLLFYSSAYASLALADAAASAAGGNLIIDSHTTLAAASALAAKQITVAGGIITLGSYDLTFTGNSVTAGATQIFNSTGAGKVKGTINAEICIDWWGTSSTSTADAATTNAGNDCFAYVVQSANPRTVVFCGKANYYLSDSWIKPESFYCPQIEGRGAVLNYTFSGKAALVLVGGSGYPAVQGHVAGLTFTGGPSSYGLEVRGQCGVTLRNLVFETNSIGIFLHNATSGQFTEFNVWRDCSFRSCKYWWRYYISGGNDSFHGSGPDGNVVCVDAAPSDARILLANNAAVYNAPCTFTAFLSTSNYPLISLGENARFLTKGDIDIEDGGFSGPITLLSAASGSRACHRGSVACWGDSFIPGALVLMESVYIKNDGVLRGTRKPFEASAVLPAGGGSVPLAGTQSTTFMLSILLNGANYYYKAVVLVTRDPFGATDAYKLREQTFGGSNWASWGAPSFSWSGSALGITNASYPSGGGAIIAYISATDLGNGSLEL